MSHHIIQAIFEELLQSLPTSSPFLIVLTDCEGTILYRRGVGAQSSFHLPPLGINFLDSVWGEHAIHKAAEENTPRFAESPELSDQLAWARFPHSAAISLRVPDPLHQSPLCLDSSLEAEEGKNRASETEKRGDALLHLGVFGDKPDVEQTGALLLHLLSRSFTHALQVNSALSTLEEKNKFEQAILRSMPHGFMVISGNNFIVTHANEAVASLLETTLDSFIGRPLTDFISSELRIREVFRTGKPMVDEEMFIRLASGRSIQVIKNVTAVSDEGGNVVAVIDHIREMRAARNLVNRLVGARSSFTFDDIIYKSTAMDEALTLAKQASQSPFSLLLQGESGTGKELFAHAIHSSSPRASGPFVVIDCASIPRELVESEFFGYTEGSFTGARRGGRAGKFEQANNGTVFLDELGELPMDIQSRLLRILQNRTVTRVGGVEPIPVDIRIIAATNRNLNEQVKQRLFREDLFYRLNVLSVTIPPLRTRPEDIEVLVSFFVPNYAKKILKSPPAISPRAFDILLGHEWPGNVRELENVIARAVHVCDDIILPEHLHFSTLQRSVEAAHPTFGSPWLAADAESRVLPLHEMEKSALVDALQQSGGNISKTARMLGVARSTIYKKIRKLGIESPSIQ